MIIQSQQSRFPPFSHKFPYVDLRVLTRHQMSVKATFVIREVSGPFLPEDSLDPPPQPFSNKLCRQGLLHNWQITAQNKIVGSLVQKSGKSISKSTTVLSLSMSGWALFAISWCSLLGTGHLYGKYRTSQVPGAPL